MGNEMGIGRGTWGYGYGMGWTEDGIWIYEDMDEI